MKNNLKLTALFIFFTFISFSQRKADPTPDEITKAKTLKEKYKDDDIVILYSKEKIIFDFDKKTSNVIVNHQINEELINIESRSDIIRYYFYDGQTDISDFNIKYRTGKTALFNIKDEAYSNQGIFHNDSRVKYVNLDFPVKGYTYKIELHEKIKDVKYFTQVFFPDEFPIVKKTITFEIPNWLEIELKELNFEGFDIQKNVSTNNNSKIYTYTAKNIAARFKDTKSPGPTYLYPHILVLAKSHMYNNEKKVLFKNTQDLYNWYKSLVEQLKNDNTIFKEKVTELVNKTTSEDQKIKNIFYWVQDNIRYIAFEDGIAGFKPDEASEVFRKRYGDCKGMANLTKQMLIEAGFDARLVWIGTKRIAYNYSTPNLSVDNHMICAVIKDQDTIFLDATEKYNPLGEYANRIQGKQALIENGKTYALKKVPNKDANFNKEIIKYNLKLNDDVLLGKASKEYHGESRTYIIHILNNIKSDRKNEAIETYLKNDDLNLKVSNVNISNIQDRESTLTMQYDIEIKNAVSSFDGETYISLNIDKELTGFEFKDRQTPFLFRTKKWLESTTEFEISKDYKVSYLPKNISIKTKDFEIYVTYKQQENKIIYNKTIRFYHAKIDTKDFEKWNSFSKNLDKIYNEQIVLIKK